MSAAFHDGAFRLFQTEDAGFRNELHVLVELLSFDFQYDFDADERAVGAELKAAVTEGMSGLLEGEAGGVEGLPGERGLNRGEHDVRLISGFGLGGHG